MAVFNKFNIFNENLAKGVHNLATDTLKVLLTNTAPTAALLTKSQLTEIAATGGYAAGGVTVPVTSAVQTSGVFKLVLPDVTITAAGGTIGPFRYAVLYDDTPTAPADPLIGWIDYGAALTLAIGESITLDFDQSAGAMTIT